jgi:hypothetical protein
MLSVGHHTGHRINRLSFLRWDYRPRKWDYTQGLIFYPWHTSQQFVDKINRSTHESMVRKRMHNQGSQTKQE